MHKFWKLLIMFFKGVRPFFSYSSLQLSWLAQAAPIFLLTGRKAALFSRKKRGGKFFWRLEHKQSKNAQDLIALFRFWIFALFFFRNVSGPIPYRFRDFHKNVPANFTIFALKSVDISHHFSERNSKLEQSYQVLCILTLFVL